MNKVLGRNLWICMLAMTAVACGGGGGGDNNAPVQDANAPDAVAQRLTVTNPNTQVVTGAAPKSTATDQAPQVTSAGDALRTAAAGDEVTIDLNILSLDGVSSLLARVTAASSYVEIADPDVTPTGGTAKALGGSNFSGRLTLNLGAALNADQFCFEIAAVDDQGRVSNYRKVCFDLPSNRPAGTAAKPTVNAGGDQTVNQGETVTLSGTAARSGGSITDHVWTQLSGEAVTLSGTGAEVTFAAPDVSGNQTLRFQLEVTAEDGQKVRDTTEVTIIDTDVNAAPTVRVGDDLTVNEGATVNLRGFASDTDGSIASLLWESSNSAVQFTSTTTRATSFVAPAVGRNGTTVTLTLTATDDDAATGSDSLIVTIANVNQVPVASDGSLSTLKNEAVNGNLRDYASDGDGENLTFTITDNVDSGSLTVAADDSFTYTPATDFTGSVSFTYQASDGLGSDTGTITILVQDQIGTNGGAGKGVIGGGSIAASEITTGGQVSRGTSTTASDGDYDLVLTGYQGGPLLISLNGGNGATMKCDVAAGCNGVAFGGDVSLPDTFQMQVLLPEVASSADLASCISPFTHLAAQRAIEVAGSLDAVTSAIARDALSEVGSLLNGVDVLRTCVIDTTSTAALARAPSKDLTLSALSAAVLSVQGATDPSAALANLSSQFAGGVITGSNLQTLVDAANVELNALGESDRTGVLVSMSQAATAAGPSGNFDPQPNAAAGGTAIEQGKALIAGIRNLGYAFADDHDGFDSTDASHPANIFYNRIVAANDQVLLQAVNDGMVLAYDEANAFYQRNPAQPGEPGSTTINSTDSSNNAQTATVTITNAANDVHTVTVVGQIGDAVVDWRLTSPTNPGTEGNRPSGNLLGDFVATVSTAAGVSPGYSLDVSGEISLTSLLFSSRQITIPSIPKASITVNGDQSDWSAVTQFADPSGDQDGNTATDLVSYAIALDETAGTANLLMVTAGDVAFPHTSGRSTSHYETGMHVYWDENCESEAGFYIANNFTDDAGNTTHQLDDYVFFSSSRPTTVADAGGVLETSFDLNVLSQFASIDLNPYIQSFGSSGHQTHDETDDDQRESTCFNFGDAGTRVLEYYQDGDVLFDVTFEFSQTGVQNPLIVAGDLELSLVNCSACTASTTEDDAINLGHFLVDAELYDEDRQNGAGFLFLVDFDDTEETRFDFREEIGPDNVPAASFTLAFDAALAGLEYDIVLAGDFRDIIGTSTDPFSGGEFTEVDADLTVRIGRDGRYLELIANEPTVVDNGVETSATFGNQDGVVLRFELRETPGTDEVSGEIFVGTTKVGDLEQTDNGLILIRWIDGSFESLG